MNKRKMISIYSRRDKIRKDKRKQDGETKPGDDRTRPNQFEPGHYQKYAKSILLGVAFQSMKHAVQCSVGS